MISNFNQFNEGKKDKFPNIKKIELDGFLILLGRDAKSNDYLTLNMAQKQDLWFHVRGVPGSHVVIKVGDKLPTEPIIRKAAELAKTNSKADKTQKATVVYCRAEFVSKEPGSNDGQVKVDKVNSYEITI